MRKWTTVSLVLAGCYLHGGLGGQPDGGNSPPTSTTFTPQGLSCDAANAIAACHSCHSNPPIGGAPMPLESDVDLKALSKTPDPNNTSQMLTYAQLCVVRMQDPKSPMPPGGPTPTQTQDVATLQAWIDAGYPSGSCSSVDDGGTLVYPTTCTSGQYTLGEDLQNRELMHPGGACNTCHAASGPDRPQYSIAGTVFPTLHEKDDCNATSVQGAQVVVTGNDGKTLTLTVNATGNFFSQANVALPFTAKVVRNGKVHAMVATQSSGDCNSCHTEQGAGGAPGRITAP